MRNRGNKIFLLLAIFIFAGCGKQETQKFSTATETDTETEPVSQAETEIPNGVQSEEDNTIFSVGDTEEPREIFIDSTGDTLEKRILPPAGYERIPGGEDSFTEFLRKYPLKEDQSPVLLYDGSEKGNQSAHQAVFALPIENEDLQQCADSVMRMYGEYFYGTGQQDKIEFHFTNGFLAEYEKWRDGGRIQVSGDSVSWVQSEDYDDSYENFRKFMRTVFIYAGTLSMEGESREIEMEEILPGDVFLKGGNPGHVVLVVDVCENSEGKKAFLLGQGYMPAQEFHVLKNSLHTDNPWYFEEEATYPFETPEYVFPRGSLKRLCYLD